jgi:MOSC domain-containing protein YiiM
MRSVESVVAEAGVGLVGDRYHGTRHRHVTIQSQELLDRAAEILGYGFDRGATRRNLTVDAGEIPTALGVRLVIGQFALEIVRVVAPCRLLDDGIGPGAAAALRRRARHVGCSRPVRSGSATQSTSSFSRTVDV